MDDIMMQEKRKIVCIIKRNNVEKSLWFLFRLFPFVNNRKQRLLWYYDASWRHKILEFNQYPKSDKAPFIIYADLCQNNPENSSTTKVSEHTGPNLDFLCVQQLGTTSFCENYAKTLFWFETLRKEIEYGVVKHFVALSFKMNLFLTNIGCCPNFLD